MFLILCSNSGRGQARAGGSATAGSSNTLISQSQYDEQVRQINIDSSRLRDDLARKQESLQVVRNRIAGGVDNERLLTRLVENEREIRKDIADLTDKLSRNDLEIQSLSSRPRI